MNILTKDLRNLDENPLIPDDEDEDKNEMKKYDFLEETFLENENDLSNAEIVLNNINLTINKGDLVVIYGKSGSGKTSLLEAILNEMKFIINRDNKFNVITTVNGKISYASQIPFIFNSTVRQNIAFDLNEEVNLNYNRYFKVVDICSLILD